MTGYTNEGVFTPDRLIVGEDIVGRKLTIKSGAGVLKRGTVLGKVTASGKYVTSASASSDGSQVPDAILAEDVDASAADVDAACYIAGMFNQNSLTLGTGHTLGSIDGAFRQLGIFLVKPVGA